MYLFGIFKGTPQDQIILLYNVQGGSFNEHDIKWDKGHERIRTESGCSSLPHRLYCQASLKVCTFSWQASLLNQKPLHEKWCTPFSSLMISASAVVTNEHPGLSVWHK